MAYHFITPVATQVPPISEADTRTAPATGFVNPRGVAVMRFFSSRPRGCNVFLMSDGTYQVDPNPDLPLTNGAGGVPSYTVNQPWPPIDISQVSYNNAGNASTSIASGPNTFPNASIAQSSLYGTGSYTSPGSLSIDPYPTPHVVKIYYGGHDNIITAGEVAALTAANFDGYISSY